MRVNAYIDGFNLYNGALKHRPACKWLDLQAMCERLLPKGCELDWVRYFTARPGWSGDPHQPQKQEIYLRAIRGECAPLSLHEGHFRTDTEWLELAGSQPIHLISDSAERELDAAMVITDDFDQEGALRMAKESEIAIDHDGHEVHRPKSWQEIPTNREAAPKDGLLPSSRSS